MTTPTRAAAVAMALPVLLVVPLLWRDLGVATLSALVSPIALALIAAGIAATVFGARYFRPGYSLEPDRWGLVVALGAIGVYLLGSLDSLPPLHYAGGGLLYLGAVIYLGGPMFAVVALPIVAACFVAASGLSGNLLADSSLGCGLLLYAVGTFRLETSAGSRTLGCPHCGERALSRLAYCAYCGRRLALPSVALPGRSVGTVLLVTGLLALMTVAQPVALTATQSGINYTTYSAAGTAVQPLVLHDLPVGWTLKNSTQGNFTAGESAAYSLASGKSNVSLLLVLSPSPYGTTAMVKSLGKASLTGAVNSERNVTLSEYAVQTGSGMSLTGLAWSAPVQYIEGGRVSTGMFSFLAAEPGSAYKADNGSDLVTLSNALIAGLTGPQSWSIPLAAVGTPLLQYNSFIMPGVFVVALLLAVASLRVRELRESRVVDNTFGLSQGEFSLYATLARVQSSQTGETFEKAASAKGAGLAGEFYGELRRLERLGLMSNHVRVRAGVPKLLWKCELA